MVIPRLSERLECMGYRRKVDLEIVEIRPDLNTLRNASRELRNSAKFKALLQVIMIGSIKQLQVDIGCIGGPSHW